MTLNQWILTISFLIPMTTTVLLGIGAALKVDEKIQSRVLTLSMPLSLFFVVLTGTLFINGGMEPIQTNSLVLFQRKTYDFSLSLYLDSVSLIFLLVTAFFGNIVAFFSRRYMHREPGVLRFLFIISFFIFGMYLAILSSNLDTLFGGWEIVGISSYLLIAFYVEREKPVRNAERVYWIYRICDIGLLLGAYFAHTVWRESSLFSEIGHAHHLEDLFRTIPLSRQWFLGGLIALAALGKSAQFPFLTWLPRALEGPTPSTAIFYGALSIHLGVYLLIRMEPVWRIIPGFAIFLGSIGIFSALLASNFGRVQTTIKGQIAYASSAQVGIMFFELALGWKTLALIHFVGNALFRGYQLLTAPSIVAEQLVLQSSIGGIVYRSRLLPEHILPRRLSESLYFFSLNEGYIDYIILSIGRTLLKPFSFMRESLFPRVVPNSISGTRWITGFLAVVFSGSLVLTTLAPEHFENTLAYFFVLGSFLFTQLALAEKHNPLLILIFVFFSQYFPILTIRLLDPGSASSANLCAFSLITCLGFAYLCLVRVSKMKRFKNAVDFHGYFQTCPRTAALFFAASISMVGFPTSFTFIGEDLIFHHLVPHSELMAAVVCINYVLNGIVLVRTFGSVFLGRADQSLKMDDFSFSSGTTLILFVLFLLTQCLPMFIWK